VTLADAVATARRRKLTGKYWHQGSTRHPLVSWTDPAAGPGRYHRTGEPGVWYASNRGKVHGLSFSVISSMKVSIHSRFVAVLVVCRSTSKYSISPTKRLVRI
jgi:hypothetical protein